METREITKAELERYIDRSILMGKQSAYTDMAQFLSGRATDLFQDGQDAAAVEARVLAKMFADKAQVIDQQSQALVQKGRSDARREQIQQTDEFDPPVLEG